MEAIHSWQRESHVLNGAARRRAPALYTISFQQQLNGATLVVLLRVWAYDNSLYWERLIKIFKERNVRHYVAIWTTESEFP